MSTLHKYSSDVQYCKYKYQIHTFRNNAEKHKCVINVGIDTPAMYIMKRGKLLCFRGQKKGMLKVLTGQHTQFN